MSALRIALVAPVATTVPPPRSGSIETMTALLADGLAARGHDVTLFAVAGSSTAARLQATFAVGYRDGSREWPWELCELFNMSAALRRAADFDVIHLQAESYPMSLAFEGLVATPLLHSLHYSPSADEVAMWRRYAEAPLVALSEEQARSLAGLNVRATIPHGLDLTQFPARATTGDYLLFLGRFTPGKGVLTAIEIATRAGVPLRLAAQANDYYHAHVEPLVDGARVRYVGELGHDEKVALLAEARALLYPVQSAEPFGLVLTEAMACGTPVAAFARGAANEIVEPGVTGGLFDGADALVAALPGVMALDRATIRARAAARFGADRMVDAYVALYQQLARRTTSPVSAAR